MAKPVFNSATGSQQKNAQKWLLLLQVSLALYTGMWDKTEELRLYVIQRTNEI